MEIVALLCRHHMHATLPFQEELGAMMDTKDRAFHLAIETLSTCKGFSHRHPMEIAEEYEQMAKADDKASVGG